MEEKKLYGQLFNSIELHNEEHLETLISTMNKDSAMFILVQAVKYGYNQGIYTLGESEVISKCIRVLLQD
jgi:hypothetical protein